MTPRDKIIEAMARALARDHHVTRSLEECAERERYINETWRRYERECSIILDALLAALPEIGAKIVPVK